MPPRCLLPVLAVVGLVATEYEPLHLIDYRERVTVADRKPLEQDFDHRLLSDLPWLAAVPRMPVPPPGFDRDHGEDTLTLAGQERRLVREEWFRRAADPAAAGTVVERMRCYYHPLFPMPSLVLNLPGVPLLVPAGTLRLDYEERPDRATGGPAGSPLPRCSFAGRWDGATTWRLGTREYPAQRFTYEHRWDEDCVTRGEIITAEYLPGQVGRLTQTSTATGRPTTEYVAEITACVPAATPAHLIDYPAGGFAYARPATFRELPAGDGWWCRYGNPQGIELAIGGEDLGGATARDWWQNRCDTLTADQPSAVRGAAGFVGFALNDPLYGFIDGAGILHAWFDHGRRGYRVRIAGFSSFDVRARREIFLGLRFLVGQTATPRP
jgi:hypothetical protein